MRRQTIRSPICISKQWNNEISTERYTIIDVTESTPPTLSLPGRKSYRIVDYYILFMRQKSVVYLTPKNAVPLFDEREWAYK